MRYESKNIALKNDGKNFQMATFQQVTCITHCNIPKVVSYAKWWYGIFQYHTTIHPISYHYLNSGMILENTIPPFAIRKRQVLLILLKSNLISKKTTLVYYNENTVTPGSELSVNTDLFFRNFGLINTYLRPSAVGMYWTKISQKSVCIY